MDHSKDSRKAGKKIFLRNFQFNCPFYAFSLATN